MFSDANSRFPGPPPPTGAHVAAPLLAGALGAVSAVGRLLVIFWEVRQHLLALVPVVIVVTLLVAYLRYKFDPRGADWLEPLRRLWEALLGLFAFGRWLSLWWGEREQRLAGTLGAAGDAPSPHAPGPSPGNGLWLDPRRAVRAAYRRYLQGGAAAGRGKESSETPAEYARRLGADLGGAAAEVHRLTSAYEEARFSDHRILGSLAAAAISAMRRTLAALRRAK